MSLREDVNKIGFFNGCMLSDSATDEIINKVLDAAVEATQSTFDGYGGYPDRASYKELIDAINKLRGEK